jgi:hypothetical protein
VNGTTGVPKRADTPRPEVVPGAENAGSADRVEVGAVDQYQSKPPSERLKITRRHTIAVAVAQVPMVMKPRRSVVTQKKSIEEESAKQQSPLKGRVI